MLISQASFDFIVQEETGGQAYYERTEIHPDWPGGASGVTVGCGYDCGYATAAQIAEDWGHVLAPEVVASLQSVAGVKGSPAASHARELHGLVSVPWSAALAVFSDIDVPRWTQNVLTFLGPNARDLSPDCLGAMVSLAFNRGCSFTLHADRYREMRAIKADVDVKNFADIPAQIRAMKRLWPLDTPEHIDLRNRRDHEAALFERGLSGATP